MPPSAPGALGALASVLTSRMSFLVPYLESAAGLTLLAASRYLALAQLGGMAGRVLFGMLSGRLFGGRRRLPLVLAGAGSALCTLAIAWAGVGTSTAEGDRTPAHSRPA